MSTIKLRKGFDLKLKGGLTSGEVGGMAALSDDYAVVPDDFTGIIPRLDRKVGDAVQAGEPLYHDKNFEQVRVVSPVSGTVKEVRRGERRKIEAIIITPDEQHDNHYTLDLKHPTLEVLLESGLWVMLRQRPYDVVPNPAMRPRDVFVTAFDSAPLAPSLRTVLGEREKYLAKGVEVMSSLTDGKVYIGCRPGEELNIAGAEVNVFDGPHPAGNAGVQAANVRPVNKGEVVWTLDVVTLARIGELFTTGHVNHHTVVAITGESIGQPRMVRATMGCRMNSLLQGEQLDGARIICGNALTGVRVEADGWLRAPYRHVTVIPEISHPDEFMGWASLSPKRFSLYRDFTSWLTGNRKPVSMDARVKGGERAIVRLDEYDRMLPMDIYAEFLIKAIIAFDIDKMEQLGIYEVAPEDFALAEFACTSKLELQRIVRHGLDRMRAE
ncbi:MAG: Na(+)-translocating NADH-quinone reductase subunit A, partial [Muribaculaceae bacterium]|nr:Na(+)-translocating NADH-quinone reductase subunit A [Muribaculaceae bacterium]